MLMKTLNIIALALCLNVSSINAVDPGTSCACCLFSCAFGPLLIQEGFHYLQKANNVEKAREEREATSSMEEGVTTAQRLPHGAWFSETYVSTRRKQGYALIAVGTMISTSAAYTTGSVIYALSSNNNQRME
jgi:hypothetical protein